jgi:predicted 3-demethylubiquinone-9 3-methyltransferase (glyoxalase superfamily)
MSKVTSKITPFLWFDTQAEKAAKFYVSIFKNARMGTVARYSEAGPGPKGSVMTVAFTLEGTEFVALNGGPYFQFNESLSFVINCNDQKEIDYFWKKLGTGGKYSQCGWLKDKFGLSWQVTPVGIADLVKKPNAMKAMLKMSKLDLAKLRAAAKGPK